jgi:hypothetical protein
VAVPLDVKLQSTDALSTSYGVLHALFTACAFLVIAGLALGIRALAIGSLSYFRYADGIVQPRRSGPRVILWAEADRLEPVRQRRIQSEPRSTRSRPASSRPTRPVRRCPPSPT